MRLWFNLGRWIGVFVIAVFVSMSTSAQNVEITDVNEDSVYKNVNDDRLDRALAGYAEDETLQTERPVAEATELPEFAAPNPVAQGIGGFFGAISPFLFWLFVALLIVLAFYVLYLVLGEGFTLRGKQKDKAAAQDVSSIPDLKPDAVRAHGLLDDADALAAEGRFAEAVHLLLFRSIDDIQEKRRGTVGRSLTAREIGALSGLPDRVRGALSPIIRIVERSFFGGREVDKTGWEEARAAYETFAFGEVWA